MLSDVSLAQLATDLFQARASAGLIPLPSQGDQDFDLPRGYRVGRLLHERLVAQGALPVGRKIGFTNPATWKEFHLDSPIWAHMYEKSVHFADQDNYRLSITGMTAPRIEPEIVVKLKRPITDGDLSVEALLACMEWVAVGFEIVDSHYPEWQFTAADAVADFGVHAALVVGTPWRVDAEEPQGVISRLRDLKVFLRRREEPFAEGFGRNALGSPLLAVGHLVRILSAQSWAPALASGEIITTGTLTPLPHVHGGERWAVEVVGAPLAPLTLDLFE